MIDPLTKALECRHDAQRTQLREPAARELLLQEGADHLRNTLGRLERHVADEAIRNDHVGLAAIDVVAFDVAHEIERRLADDPSVIIIPLSTISDANSGGVFSKTVLIHCNI